MQTLIIYHRDCWDGIAAAWAATKGLSGGIGTFELMSAQYKEEPPAASEIRYRDVYIVDFSYPREDLLKMKRLANTLQVYDHHETAKEALEGLDFCTFDMNRSGAGLVWDELVGKPRPRFIDYVEDRDLWRFNLKHSKTINAYMRSWPATLGACNKLAADLVDEELFNEAARHGETLLRMEDKQVRRAVDRGRLSPLPGIETPCWACNSTEHASRVGNDLAKAHDGLGAVWQYQHDGTVRWELRGDGRVDVSKIAKKFGGGGHKNASGFIINTSAHLEILRQA